MIPERKRLITMAAAVMSVLAAGSMALGQAQSQPNRRESPVYASKLNLSMEQRHIIKEFIKSRTVASEPGNAQIVVGQVVPKTVLLQAMPADVGKKVSQVRNYVYFLKNHQVVLVDPKDNKVAEVIDLQ